MTTCCRRARFSRTSSRCDFSDENSDATIARISANIMLPMLKPAAEKVNYFNAIELLGGTPRGATDLTRAVECRERLGGILNYYYREAA